ncbi:MAG: nucleotidyltransferase domain-containing protein [Bacteroidetes bacterium]|nr:nucleotidyltransferase domain-containing protein [Bacteroidota bacterium]
MNSELTNEFGLKARDMNTIFSILDKYHEILLVNIYGSRARSTFKFGSDVDLAIINPGIGNETLHKLTGDFEESSLPYRVDIVNITTLNQPDLISQIKKFGKTFYEKKACQQTLHVNSLK